MDQGLSDFLTNLLILYLLLILIITISDHLLCKKDLLTKITLNGILYIIAPALLLKYKY